MVQLLSFCIGVEPLIPRLHDQANIKQTSSERQANVEQTSSKYEVCIKHSLHETNIKQTSCWLIQLTRVSSSSQLYRVNGV